MAQLKSGSTVDNKIIASEDYVSSSITTYDVTVQQALDAKLASSAYTASDVLTKIKTVDGSGSGLDADLLDGNHASAFSLSTHNHSGTYQTLDADLTAIATLAGTSGFLKKTAADTWSLDTSTYSLSTHNHNGTYQPVDADLTAIAGLTGTTGLLRKTAANTWTLDATVLGDMVKTVYDPTNKNADAFSMANMVEGTTNKILTATERTKLSGIADNANNYVHPSTHSADIIVDGTTNKAYTATEQTKLSGIATGANNYVHPTTSGNKHIPSGGSSGQVLKYSADGTAVWETDNDTITTINGNTGAIAKADIVALGIPAQDTVYTHPANHAPSIITQDANNRFVSDTEKSTWNGKANVQIVRW